MSLDVVEEVSKMMSWVRKDSCRDLLRQMWSGQTNLVRKLGPSQNFNTFFSEIAEIAFFFGVSEGGVTLSRMSSFGAFADVSVHSDAGSDAYKLRDGRLCIVMTSRASSGLCVCCRDAIRT